MLEPQCMLGARELCAALADLAHGCDAGDADDCIAVGQFVEDTPPRPWIVAATFFMQACRIGDATGCERFEQINSIEPRPCKDDPLACGRRAMFTQDRQLNEEACSLGIADSCAHLAWIARNDVARARVYLERACQLGWAGACEGLARQLRPDCVPSETQQCWPPDPVAASAAREMTCAAGFGDEALCRF